jgi:hypothetical protein
MDSKNANIFEAKGRGYFNRLPNRIVPTVQNATAVLTNKMNKLGTAARVQPLWLTEISTNYNLSVNYGQGPQGQTTYPHNLQQPGITAVGITPNQFEYDKIVAFCTEANHNLLNFKNPGGLQSGTAAIELRLYSYFYNQQSWFLKPSEHNRQLSQEYDGWLYDVAVEKIEAGHERFKNTREYSIQFTVIDDHLQTRTVVEDDIYNALYKDYIKGLLPFGLAGAVKPPTRQETDTNQETTVSRPDINNLIWGAVDPNNPFNNSGFPGT